MKWFAYIVLFFATPVFSQTIKWPGHKKAVIVLTYDDGIQSQLKNAVPELEAAGLPATFFLMGDINPQTIPQWRALAKKGYELANHTLFHPCSSGQDNPVSSDNYTVSRILSEIATMNNMLYAVDGKTSRTYAYPCTETSVGGKYYVDSLRKTGFIKYARVGGDDDAIITDFKHLDPLLIPSFGLEDDITGQRLINYVKKVQKSGGMGIIMFHGIGGDYITTPLTAHTQLINYLNKNKDVIWVTTFQKAMDYVTQAVK